MCKKVDLLRRFNQVFQEWNILFKEYSVRLPRVLNIWKQFDQQYYSQLTYHGENARKILPWSCRPTIRYINIAFEDLICDQIKTSEMNLCFPCYNIGVSDTEYQSVRPGLRCLGSPCSIMTNLTYQACRGNRWKNKQMYFHLLVWPLPDRIKIYNTFKKLCFDLYISWNYKVVTFSTYLRQVFQQIPCN